MSSHDLKLEIFPGNTGMSPRVFAHVVGNEIGGGSARIPVFEITLAALNPNATVAPTYARINKIRLAANSYFYPPANTFSADGYVLYGLSV